MGRRWRHYILCLLIFTCIKTALSFPLFVVRYKNRASGMTWNWKIYHYTNDILIQSYTTLFYLVTYYFLCTLYAQFSRTQAYFNYTQFGKYNHFAMGYYQHTLEELKRYEYGTLRGFFPLCFCKNHETLTKNCIK